MTDSPSQSDHSGVKGEPSREAQFKQRFAALLAELTAPEGVDAQTMTMIGALARRIMDDAKVTSWQAFKLTQTAPLYDATLRTFQKQGNALVADGKLRTAYAVQVLAMSLIARTQKDAAVQAGDRQLDGIIDFAASQPRSPGQTAN